MTSRRLASVAALALVGVGCGAKPATGLVVVVDADPQLAARLGSIRVQTFSPTGLTPIDEQVIAVGLVRSRFPISFGVSPREGSTQVRVEVTGLETGRPIVFARAATRYVEGRVLTLPITLWGACADQLACASPVNTCGRDGVCGATTAVDPATLTDYTASAATPCPANMVRSMGACVVLPDASAADAPVADVAPDAPAVDAGTMDATVDAPDVPTVDAPDVPDAPAVDAPDAPAVDAPDVPAVDAPDVPDVPSVDVPPDVPSVDVPADLGADVVDAGPPACGAGLTRCGASCVDLATEEAHCGACGNACATGDVCTSSKCGYTVVGVAAGLRHSCALLHNGNTRCWGGSLTNDLANNDLRMFSTSQRASTPLGAREVGAGAGLGCVRHGADDRVRCWGDNESGSVGVGVAGAPREAAEDVEFVDGTALTGVTALALHASHSCALRSAGGVVCWGANGRGQLGDGSTVGRPHAVVVSTAASTPLANITGVAVSVTASYALTASGRVYAWGGNLDRELGVLPETVTSRFYAAEVPGLVQARRVFAGGANACIIGTDDQLYCWGANASGQLGAVTGAQFPLQVDVGGPVTDVAIGHGFICALRTDRSVRCLGANRLGQLGSEPPVDRNTPAAVGAINDAVAIAAGADHVCALRAGNVVSCWGSDRFGQTGSRRVLFRSTPQLAPPIPGGASGLAAMEGGTCSRLSAAGAYCWGLNARGALGDGTTISRGVPQPVRNETGGSLTSVTQIVGGASAACALAGSFMYCWGANGDGTLGTGTTTDERYPENITALTDVTSMGLGFGTACAVHNSGSLSCWGRNATAQTGSRAAGVTVNAPRRVYDSEFLAVAPGLTHTCAVRADRKVVCFGSGSRGELGDGSTVLRDAPATPSDASVQVGSPVAGGSGRLTHAYSSVASGARFSCGVTLDGMHVHCWGDNTLGQLGRAVADGSPHPDAAPVDGLPTSPPITAITAGRNHACAVTGQRVYCWGDNTFGATGATATTPTLRATQVAGVANATAVAAGSSHTCAIDFMTGVFCWGLDGDGQLGGTVPIYRTTPVNVAVLP